MGRAYGIHAEKMNAYTGVLVRITKGKSPLGRPRHRLEDKIKMDLGGIRY
jgi:hypothetical protein